MMTTARRYAPSKTAELEPAVVAALTEAWVNTAAICKALGRWSDDHCVRTALRHLTANGVIERRAGIGVHGGTAYFYRRRA